MITLADLARLLLLGALWGASFLFLRLAVPSLGPIALIAIRVAIAALMILLLAHWLRQPLHLRRDARSHLILGLLNSALPFVLFAYAALSLQAATLAVINASAPLFAALLAWGLQGQRPRLPTAIGLLAGLGGVALMLGNFGLAANTPWPALCAAIAAPVSYGAASLYARSQQAPPSPLAATGGSMLAATLILLPAVPFALPATPPPASALLAALALGLFCTGAAYLLYFRLIASLGAIPALSVTYLIPAFGILWGVLFLGETVGPATWMGLLGILSGTALVTGFAERLWQRRGT